MANDTLFEGLLEVFVTPIVDEVADRLETRRQQSEAA